MLRRIHTVTHSWLADCCVTVLLGTILYALIRFAGQCRSDFVPETAISLNFSSLPLYTLYSATRGLIAYGLSFAITLIVGYTAAHSRSAEKIILPIIDILQSIPVLGFLPGAVLSLIALFPHSSFGLELSAILMIVTGQVWNLIFAFYASLKSIPNDFHEAAAIARWSPFTKLLKLELPISALNLAWNSMMSMAGGWFFLTVCEAFTLGHQSYRLPGIGSYMAVAVDSGNFTATLGGIGAMIVMIVAFDTCLWRPILAIAHHFRLENEIRSTDEAHLTQFILRESKIVRFWKVFIKKIQKINFNINSFTYKLPKIHCALPQFIGVLTKYLGFAVMCGGLFVCGRLLVNVLAPLSWCVWREVGIDTMYTCARVFLSLALATLWTVPIGIWLSRKPERLRVAQPLAQLLASFPAPMLYPLAIAVLQYGHIPFGVGSIFLMLLGVQWYVLFNVIAGVSHIPGELEYTTQLIGTTTSARWWHLYIPSILPSLITGWITAAGGAWNASIVAEYVAYRGDILMTRGIGARISQSSESGNFAELAASIVVMVAVVVLLNRTLWSRLYQYVNTRYRLDF